MTKREVVDAITGGKRDPVKERVRAFAPANVALCKYWGKRDEELNLPITSSISVSLGPLGSRTELALSNDWDVVVLNGRELPADHPARVRVVKFLDLFRPSDDIGFQLVSRNTVPMGAGVASSASGFASLVLALNGLFGWKLDGRQLSILARLGSGSACRSVYDGFVYWHAGRSPDGLDSFAERIQLEWPGLRVGVLLISGEEKRVSSREAMRRTVESSPLYAAWPAKVERDLSDIRAAIERRDLELLGRTAEGNALAMHAVTMAAWPPIIFFRPETIAAMQAVWDLRASGVPVYFTADAGPNLKLLFLEEHEPAVREAFPDVEVVTPFGR